MLSVYSQHLSLCSPHQSFYVQEHPLLEKYYTLEFDRISDPEKHVLDLFAFIHTP